MNQTNNFEEQTISKGIVDTKKRPVKKPIHLIIVIVFAVIVFLATLYVWFIAGLPNNYFFDYLLHSTEFPYVLAGYLIKIAVMVFLGVIFGFLAEKLISFIATGFFTVIFVIIRITSIMGKSFSLMGLDLQLYYIFDPILIAGLLILGNFLGIFLGKDFWMREEKKEKVESK